MAKETQQNVPVVFPVPSYKNLEMERRLTASHLGGTHLHPKHPKQEDVPCITQETGLHSLRPPGRYFPRLRSYSSFLRERPFVSFTPTKNLFHRAALPLGLVHTVSFVGSRHVLITCYSSNEW